MKNLDAETTPIGALLSQDFFFRVPEYQRPFSWDTDNFDDLIDDVVSADREQDYFLGTIVLHHLKDGGHYDVVDGQQRLTSVLILMACLRDLVDNDDFKSGLQAKILQEANVVDGIPQKVRIEVKDRQIFHELVVKTGGTETSLRPAELPEPERRYVEAARIFRSKLEPLKQSELEALISFVSQKCVVIYLATPTFGDAFRLFTIINDRGKQLRRIDVLKALNIAPGVITSETVRTRVAQLWEEAEKDLGEDNFEGVFHLLRLVLLKDKPQGDLLKEFQNRVFDKGTVHMGEPFLDLMFEYVGLYKGIFVDRDFVPEEDGDHARYRALIHIMDAEFRASEWRACLLLYAKRFGGEGFYDFCLRMEKVYLSHWVQGVRKDERYAEYSKILGSLQTAKTSKEARDGISFEPAVISEAAGRPNLYSVGFGKYFLLRLELVTAEHDAIQEFRAKSVEHVLPQHPDPDGYWAQHHDLDKIEDYVDSIGNLVLLSKSKNSAARNFDFDKKKEKYLTKRVSDYPRSIQVLSYATWDKKTIEERTAAAQQLILKDP